MSDEADDAAAVEEQSHITRETGPYILRPLLNDIPLAADGHRDAVRISCVELWRKFIFGLRTTDLDLFLVLTTNGVA